MNKIYVGRWDLLPKEWEGYNGLSEKSEEEISDEVNRQMNAYFAAHDDDDFFIGSYTPNEFEETFNQCLTRFINSNTHWIKIF